MKERKGRRKVGKEGKMGVGRGKERREEEEGGEGERMDNRTEK